MNAVVFHGIGDIRLENVKDPALKQAGDAIVKKIAIFTRLASAALIAS